MSREQSIFAVQSTITSNSQPWVCFVVLESKTVLMWRSRIGTISKLEDFELGYCFLDIGRVIRLADKIFACKVPEPNHNFFRVGAVNRKSPLLWFTDYFFASYSSLLPIRVLINWHEFAISRFDSKSLSFVMTLSLVHTPFFAVTKLTFFRLSSPQRTISSISSKVN